MLAQMCDTTTMSTNYIGGRSGICGGGRADVAAIYCSLTKYDINQYAPYPSDLIPIVSKIWRENVISPGK